MTATVPTVTAGDDVRVTATLTKDGASYDASGATIYAAITDAKGATTYVGATAQSSGTTGADWASGVVVCAFGASTTGALPYGRCYLEIQVAKGGVTTTWPLIQLWSQRGVIP